MQVSLAHHRPGSVKRFPQVIAAMPGVLECHYLTGEVDYLLKVVVPTHEHLERFVFDRLMKVPGVDRIRTSIALREVKASRRCPVFSRPPGSGRHHARVARICERTCDDSMRLTSAARSWVSRRPLTRLPIQNLPFGVFARWRQGTSHRRPSATASGPRAL
jgi:hypothetical protein